MLVCEGGLALTCPSSQLSLAPPLGLVPLRSEPFLSSLSADSLHSGLWRWASCALGEGLGREGWEVSRCPAQTPYGAASPSFLGFSLESEWWGRRIWEAEEGRAPCTPLPCRVGSTHPGHVY